MWSHMQYEHYKNGFQGTKSEGSWRVTRRPALLEPHWAYTQSLSDTDLPEDDECCRSRTEEDDQAVQYLTSTAGESQFKGRSRANKHILWVRSSVQGFQGFLHSRSWLRPGYFRLKLPRFSFASLIYNYYVAFFSRHYYICPGMVS